MAVVHTGLDNDRTRCVQSPSQEERGSAPVPGQEEARGERLFVHIKDVLARRLTPPQNIAQLAEAAGVSRATINAWRAGTAPTGGTLQRVADALGVPVADLWEAWHGNGFEPAEPPALRELREQTRLLRQLLTVGQDLLAAAQGFSQVTPSPADVAEAQDRGEELGRRGRRGRIPPRLVPPPTGEPPSGDNGAG